VRDFITIKMRSGFNNTVTVELDESSTAEEVIEALCYLMISVTYEPSTVQPYLDLAERMKRAPTA